ICILGSTLWYTRYVFMPVHNLNRAARSTRTAGVDSQFLAPLLPRGSATGRVHTCFLSETATYQVVLLSLERPVPRAAVKNTENSMRFFVLSVLLARTNLSSTSTAYVYGGPVQCYLGNSVMFSITFRASRPQRR
ncbi:unnamed protein product, partial [Laminaria digitata]